MHTIVPQKLWTIYIIPILQHGLHFLERPLLHRSLLRPKSALDVLSWRWQFKQILSLCVQSKFMGTDKVICIFIQMVFLGKDNNSHINAYYFLPAFAAVRKFICQIEIKCSVFSRPRCFSLVDNHICLWYCSNHNCLFNDSVAQLIFCVVVELVVFLQMMHFSNPWH